MSKCKTTGLSQTTDWLSYSECPSSMLCKEESTTGHFTKLSMTWKPFRRTAITSDSVWRSIKFTLKTSTICATTPPSAMSRKQWHRSLNECGTARRRRQWRDTWLSFCSPDMVFRRTECRWCSTMSLRRGQISTNCSGQRLSCAPSPKSTRILMW